MIKPFQLFLLTALVLGLSSSPLLAGDDDGGAKRDSTIEVVNDFGFPIGVVLDADEDDLRDAADDSDPQDVFENELGGVILMQGQTAEFDVKAGAHQIFVIDAGNFENVAEATIEVEGGETRTLFVIDYLMDIALIVSSAVSP